MFGYWIYLYMYLFKKGLLFICYHGNRFYSTLLYRKMLKKVRLIKYHQIDIVRQVLFGKSPWFIACRHVINPYFVVIDSIPVFSFIIIYGREYHCVVTKGQLIVLIITRVDRNTYHKHLHIKIFLHALLLFARTLSVVNISNAYQTFITVTHT